MPDPPPALRRVLGWRDGLGIVVGTVIGSGVFVVPGTVLRQVDGAVGTALLIWLVAGIATLLGALTYGELAASRPESGGLYVYIRESFGPAAGFAYGWATFWVIGSGSVAALAVAFAAYVREFVPLSNAAGKVVAVLLIAVIGLINARGTRRAAAVQNWVTLLKVAAIVIMSVLLLWSAVGEGAAPARVVPDTGIWPQISAIGLAAVGVLWAYDGWIYSTFSTGELRNPQRDFPRAVVLGTVVLIAVYLLANLAYMAALGPERAAGSDRIAAEAVSARFGATAGKLVAGLILLSIAGAANGLTLTTPRLYFAMARDELFFRRLGVVNTRTGAPTAAILAGSVWAMVLAVTGTFVELLTAVVFASWIFYALGALSLFAQRRRQPVDDPGVRRFRVPGYPVTPLLFVACSAAVVLATAAAQPVRALLGLAVVGLALPAFYMWRASARSAQRPTPGMPSPPSSSASS